MAKTTLNLFYSLVPNTLPETDGYHAAVSHVGTVDAATFYSRVAKRRAGLDASTAELVLSSVCGTVAEMLQERQCRVALGDVSFELAIPGSTDSVDGAMAGPAYVAVRPSAAIRNAAAGVTPVYSAGDGERTEVFSVENLAAHRLGEIAGTEAFRLTGCNISASGEGESLKVVAADGTEAFAEVTDEDGLGKFITAHLPAALPPGKGRVVLTTRGKRTPEGEPRPLPKSVTILAGETPPGPAPTLTGINSPEQESPGIEWDSGLEMHGTGLALGSGDKVEAKLEGDPSAQWYDLTGYVDGESSGAELIVLGGDSWEVLGDDVGLDADHTSARFRVTVGGQSAEIVGTALVP